MPLGDSITKGVGSTDKNGYRAQLRKYLTASARQRVDFRGSQLAGTPGDRGHEGHGGWGINQIREQVDAWLATYRPDVVLLHIGTNDVTRGRDPHVIAANLSALIDQIRIGVPAAHVFVAKIVATAGPAAEVTRNLQYNALIPAVVAGKDDHVHLVDHSSVQGLALFDLHHPNDYGYQKMAYLWYAAMDRVLAHGAWRNVKNPDTATSMYVCQYNFDRMRRECGRQAGKRLNAHREE